MYHFTVGRGFPSAEQSSFTEFPTGTARRLRLIVICRNVNLGAPVKHRTALAFEHWTSRQPPGISSFLTHFRLQSKHYFILSVLQYWSYGDGSEFYHMRGKITKSRLAETGHFFLITRALLVIKRKIEAKIYWLQCNWIKPCNIDNCTCILRIKCSLNPFNSYVCFDICSGIERDSWRGHCAQMKFLQIFCHLCDKKVMAALCKELL